MSLWQKIKQAFELHRENFSKFHLHITFMPEELTSMYIKQMRRTHIILPSAEKIEHQHQTVEYLYPDTKLPDHVDETGVIGMKLEGLGCKNTKQIESVGFCYLEFHEKFPLGGGESYGPSDMLSWSVKNQMVVTARRTKNTDEYKGGEICVFEEWTNNIEENWQKTPPTKQYDIIKKMKK